MTPGVLIGAFEVTHKDVVGGRDAVVFQRAEEPPREDLLVNLLRAVDVHRCGSSLPGVDRLVSRHGKVAVHAGVGDGEVGVASLDEGENAAVGDGLLVERGKV